MCTHRLRGWRWTPTLRAAQCRQQSSSLSHGSSAELQEATGVAPAFVVESFSDLGANVRQSILRVRRSPFLLTPVQFEGSSTTSRPTGCGRSSWARMLRPRQLTSSAGQEAVIQGLDGVRRVPGDRLRRHCSSPNNAVSQAALPHPPRRGAVSRLPGSPSTAFAQAGSRTPVTASAPAIVRHFISLGNGTGRGATAHRLGDLCANATPRVGRADCDLPVPPLSPVQSGGAVITN